MRHFEDAPGGSLNPKRFVLLYQFFDQLGVHGSEE